MLSRGSSAALATEHGAWQVPRQRLRAVGMAQLDANSEKGWRAFAGERCENAGGGIECAACDGVCARVGGGVHRRGTGGGGTIRRTSWDGGRKAALTKILYMERFFS
jgi:hypothetical protein